MKLIGYLEGQDVIRASDYCRPIDLVYEGQSDHLFTSSAYGATPMNHTRWLEVSRAGIDWYIGKTVGEFNLAQRKRHKAHQYSTEYEFVRGEIPENAILGMTYNERMAAEKEEFYSRKLVGGKFKGLTVKEAEEKNPQYVEWLKDHAPSIAVPVQSIAKPKPVETLELQVIKTHQFFVWVNKEGEFLTEQPKNTHTSNRSYISKTKKLEEAMVGRYLSPGVLRQNPSIATDYKPTPIEVTHMMVLTEGESPWQKK